MRGIALAILIGLLGLAFTGGAPQSQSLRVANSYTSIQEPVEQQTLGGATQPDTSLWVLNPGSQPNVCVWDADDRTETTIIGSLGAGERYEWSGDCLIADWASHVISLDMGVDTSKGKSFTPSFRGGLTLHGPSYHFELELNPAQDGRRHWSALGCIVGPRYEGGFRLDEDGNQYIFHSPLLISIPDSNGGYGMPVTITVWIENTGTRVLENVGMGLKLRNAALSYWVEQLCPGSVTYEGYDPKTGWSE